MTGKLYGRTDVGSHSYKLSNGCVATRMMNSKWMVFDENGRDLGLDYFDTLSACRAWANEKTGTKSPS